MSGVYVAGASPLHRLGAGAKLAALAIFALGVTLLPGWRGAAAGAVALGVAWAASGLGARRLVQALRPLALLLAVLFIAQAVTSGPVAAAASMLTLVVVVAAASLVSHTTRTDAMLDAVRSALRPLRRVGVAPETAAFMVVLTVRLVPFVATVGRQALDARLARGAAANPLPAVVPAVIRLMRETDTLAEALVARGFERT